MTNQSNSTDKKKMPVPGGGPATGKPDGVSGSPDPGATGQVHGRSLGGESGGGPYPNPYSDKESDDPGASGRDPQKAYYGGDNPNATANPPNPLDADKHSAQGARPAVQEPHEVEADGRTFEVLEESGVAAAVATGKVGTEARDEPEQESPGSG